MSLPVCDVGSEVEGRLLFDCVRDPCYLAAAVVIGSRRLDSCHLKTLDKNQRKTRKEQTHDTCGHKHTRKDLTHATRRIQRQRTYGVASGSRIDKIMSLFCERAL